MGRGGPASRLAAGLPLDYSNARPLPDDYAGDVLLWDIDKTYLDTHFSSLRGLLRIPFELAIDKQSIAGAVPVLRALRHGPAQRSSVVPLYFVSGSPPQLRRTLERRMTLDGVDFDGITFKDQLWMLRHGQPRRITEQVGYKLCALLLYRRQASAKARWLLFGDDVEADAGTFLLFGEICAGLRDAALAERLRGLGVASGDIEAVLRLAAPLPVSDDPVERVFIHLAAGSRPERFSEPRISPTRSYLQTILLLLHSGRVRPVAVGAVARELRLRGMAEAQLRAHLDDAVERLGVPAELTALART